MQQGRGEDRDNGITVERIRSETRTAISGFMELCEIRPGQVVVLGCSTSEIQGERIGSFGSEELAGVVLDEVMAVCEAAGADLAVQCCEHLNRALVVERRVKERYGLVPVTVLPVVKAGGATAAVAYERFEDPVVVDGIKAHAGIDIGDTLIGMHLRPVAVPVRVGQRWIGKAYLTLARTRPRLIGGSRAVYPKGAGTGSGGCSS